MERSITVKELSFKENYLALIKKTRKYNDILALLTLLAGMATLMIQM